MKKENKFLSKLKYAWSKTVYYFKKATSSRMFWNTGYALLGIALTITVVQTVFTKSYVKIYVSGQSMNPTLNGGHSGGARPGDTVDFGFMDNSKNTIDSLKRFNIVITYFPYAWNSSDYTDETEQQLSPNASYKIKRVIGMPNERVEVITQGDLKQIKIDSLVTDYSYTYTYSSSEGCFIDQFDHHYNFQIANGVRNCVKELGENEYFVMGDNWNGSNDSSGHLDHALQRHNIQGVLIAIEGTATVTDSRTIDNLVYKQIKYYYKEL